MSTPKQLVSIHRWLGVALCLFIAAWFASGVVLMYVPFPALAPGERIQRSSDVGASRLLIAPAEAIAASGATQPIDSVRLVSRDQRPVYVISPRGRDVTSVWADDGGSAVLEDPEHARSIAAAFSGRTVRRVDGPLAFDQWIVHQAFDRQRPFFRVHLEDEAATVLYVSQRSGEVLQRTVRRERAWNYVGAVVHWIYPTVLRKHWAAWDQVVWWLSLAGICGAALGAWLGIDRMRAAARVRPGSITLYRGWMRWHHILGLVAGLFVLTWIFSGWLSMDHGRLFSKPDPTTEQLDNFRGASLVDVAQRVDMSFLRSLGRFREIEIKAVAGSPLAIVRSANDRQVYLLANEPVRTPGVPKPLVMAAIRRAWSHSNVVSVDGPGLNDVYSRLREGSLADSVIRVRLDDPHGTWVHVDVASGDIVSVMDRGRRLYRWLFNGLHSLDFPGLVNHRPLWDLVMLALMALGLAFSVTGAYLGMKRLGFSLRRP